MAELIFTVLAGAIFLFAPYLFGVYIFEENEFVRTIPLFDLANWHMILPILLFCLTIGFVDVMIRLATGCYCKMVMFSSILSGVIQLILSYCMLKLLPFWNQTFLEEAKKHLDWKTGSSDKLILSLGMDSLSDFLLAFIWICILIEMGTAIYKTLRYGTR